MAGSFSNGCPAAGIDFPPIVGQGVEAQHSFHQISIELDEDAHVGDARSLRLPLTRTILVRVDGDAAALRHSIDGLLSSIQQSFLDDRWYKLKRDDDGMWSLQLGVLAPAMMVTDDWLVVSFSPFAVKKNVDMLAPAPTAEPGLAASSHD